MQRRPWTGGYRRGPGLGGEYTGGPGLGGVEEALDLKSGVDKGPGFREQGAEEALNLAWAVKEALDWEISAEEALDYGGGCRGGH